SRRQLKEHLRTYHRKALEQHIGKDAEQGNQHDHSAQGGDDRHQLIATIAQQPWPEEKIRRRGGHGGGVQGGHRWVSI
ncbi:MAG: hypothetical protein EBX50_23030, partial [Chitinophagia bacterium]|nr:hypothetical protein [Chitinophagia bacterium]